jgi:hypothetical protein
MGTWTEGVVQEALDAESLAPSQPDRGLVWVTRGTLRVRTASGAVHEIEKGGVVAFRAGPGLAWTASRGTCVRFSLRDVSVAEGEIEPWTSDVSPADLPPAPAVRRRPWLSVAAVATLWLAAIAVAWCYGNSQAGFVSDRIGALPALPAAPVGLAADLSESLREAGLEVESTLALLSARPPRLVAYVEISTREDAVALGADGGPLATATEAWKGFFSRHADVSAVDVIPIDPARSRELSGGAVNRALWGPTYRLDREGRVVRR